MSDTGTLIIGGGVSGLALAQMLEDAGRAYLLAEARARFGGRILSLNHGGGAFDMGPAWVWPGQPRIAALLARMGLETFAQYCDGAQSFEDPQGRVMQGQGPHAMADARRVAGGLAALTVALARGLPAARIRPDARVTALCCDGPRITATLACGTQITADRAVLALPPRLAAQITYDPPLPERTMETLGSVPTWMAGHAKALAVFDTPFWRDAGLSGSAMSRRGPMVEIHDASPAKGGPYALFGFIGVPPDARRDEPALRDAVRAQLVRLFGAQAAKPAALFIKDWARDPDTAVARDSQPLRSHPAYGMPPALGGLWNGRLSFAGSEVAAQWGGYIEGALESADAARDAVARAEQSHTAAG
jgi:monoamine oxidase